MVIHKIKKLGKKFIIKSSGTEYECHSCGYRWGSKREDPPIKCPRCNSEDMISVW